MTVNYIPEVPTDDFIFNDNNAGGFGNRKIYPSNSYINDKHYGHPDYYTYMFSNTPKSYYAIHRNNIVTTIPTKLTIPMNKIYQEYKLSPNSCSSGVFIVEYFSVKYNLNMLKHIADYYRGNTLKYTDDTKRRIMMLSQSNEDDPYTIRLITFIPENEILKEGHIYVTSTGTVITNNLDYDLVNPDSISEQHIHHKNKKNGLTVHISIIDNDNDHGTTRYANILGNVFDIKSKRDIKSKSGCSVTILKNGSTIQDNNSSLKATDSIEWCRLYPTEDEARNNGMKLELSKLQLEYNKLTLEHEKLEHERDMMQQKLKIQMLNVEQQKITGIQSIQKHQLDMKMTIHKAVNDIIVSKNKVKHDIINKQSSLILDKLISPIITGIIKKYLP